MSDGISGCAIWLIVSIGIISDFLWEREEIWAQCNEGKCGKDARRQDNPSIKDPTDHNSLCVVASSIINLLWLCVTSFMFFSQPLSFSHNSFNSFPPRSLSPQRDTSRSVIRELYTHSRFALAHKNRLCWDEISVKNQNYSSCLFVFCLAWQVDGPKIVFLFYFTFFCCVFLELCVSPHTRHIQFLCSSSSLPLWFLLLAGSPFSHLISLHVILHKYIFRLDRATRHDTKYDQLMDIFIASIYFLSACSLARRAPLDICLSRDTFRVGIHFIFSEMKQGIFFSSFFSSLLAALMRQ